MRKAKTAAKQDVYEDGQSWRPGVVHMPVERGGYFWFPFAASWEITGIRREKMNIFGSGRLNMRSYICFPSREVLMGQTWPKTKRGRSSTRAC